MTEESNVRPLYESADDRAREAEIATKIERLLSRKLIKLPMQYRLDYMVMDDERLTAWVEIKRRFHTFDNYPNVFLSLAKVMAARELNAATGLPCRFFVQFNDCLAHADMCKPGRALRFSGRFDREDWQDIEPLVLIPMDQWKIIEAVHG